MSKKVDKRYCASSYLQYRTVYDRTRCFAEGVEPTYAPEYEGRAEIHDSRELGEHIASEMKRFVSENRAALALSGGIDSAILAKFMPEGSQSYTFKCVVPGIEVADETPIAAKYAADCDLKHHVIEMWWEDFERYAPILMRHKGAPIHSIEVQIYKAALQAKADGYDALIFGESADVNYGGMSGLLSREWSFEEFVERYSYVDPSKVLREWERVTEPIEKYTVNGMTDAHEFNRNVFLRESLSSYHNACECAGIKFLSPFATSRLAVPLDIERVRRGENKYLVREVFNGLFPSFEIPPKLPMPRATNEWFRDWSGPVREEFREGCVEGLGGDQRWLVWCLERFFRMIDEGDFANEAK